MEQLDESDKKINLRKNNSNHFTPLYESDDEEVTKHRKKHKTPIILLIKKEKGMEKRR